MPDLVALPEQVTRRTFAGAALAGAALLMGACEALDGSGAPGASATPTVTATADAPDADAELAADLGRTLAEAAALATVTASAFPGLARAAERLARLHTTHAAELGHTTPATAPTVATSRAAAERTLVAAEETLQQELVDGSLRAEGGALAQVLASMAAAVAQQRVVLG